MDQNTQPFQPPIKAEQIYQTPQQQPLPVKQDNIEQDTMSSPKKTISKALIISLIVILIVVISLLFYYFAFKPYFLENNIVKTKAVNNQTNDQTTNNSSPTPDYHIAAYLTRTDFDTNPINIKIIFFDFQQQKIIDTPKSLNIKPGNLITLGQWSPDGRYLPIQSQPIKNECDQCLYTTYIYDAKTNSANAIFSFPDTAESFSNYTWAYGTGAVYKWLDNTTIVVDPDISKQEITTMDLNGKLSTQKSKHWLAYKNEGIFYSLLSPTLSTSPYSSEIQSIKINGINFPFQIEGVPIGVYGKNLITIDVPKELHVGCDDYTCTEDTVKLNELTKNTPKEELLTKSFDLIYPPGKDIISYYQIDNGQLVNTLTLPSLDWHTTNIQLIDSVIIAHQVNRSLLPEKERFIKIDVSSLEISNIFEEKHSDADNQFKLEQNMLGNNSDFYLSPDGLYILDFSDPFTNPNILQKYTYTVKAKSISNNNEFTVCTSCSEIRVHNPWITTVAY